MRPIFILEDNQQQRLAMEKIVNYHLTTKKYPMEITLSTHDPQELIQSVADTQPTGGIYLFDIDLNTVKSGMDVAQDIKAIDPCPNIVFITTHAELSFLTFRYKLDVVDYIIKDQIDQVPTRIAENLDHINRYPRQKPSTETIPIDITQTETQHVPLIDIMFIETHHTISRKLILHTRNGRTEFYGVLNSMEDIHPAFYRAHRSTLLNINNVQGIDKASKSAIMVNGAQAVISRLKIRELENIIKQQESNS